MPIRGLEETDHNGTIRDTMGKDHKERKDNKNKHFVWCKNCLLYDIIKKKKKKCFGSSTKKQKKAK
eukprot:9941605-Ditylum_brightwellii.AAC.1